MNTRLKICGITSEDDARLAVGVGATAVGMILVPGTARSIDLMKARWIAEAVPDGTERVAVVRDLARDDLDLLLRTVPVSCVQFHGQEPAEVAKDLPVKVIRALTFGDADAPRTIERWQELAPGTTFLLDRPKQGWTPDADEFLDWARALPVCRQAYLAGGLTADNVEGMLERVRPAGVDVARGVEAVPGVKDADLLRAFAAAVRRFDGKAGSGT